VAAVGAYAPPELPRPVGVAMLTGVVIAVVAVSSSVWAGGGAALGRLVDDGRRRRSVAIAFAVLLVGSVALLWI